MIIPTATSYNPKNEYDAKCLLINDGRNKWFYSHKTLIGFKKEGKELIISNKIWTKTTGKHLNFIKKLYNNCYKQVDNDDFQKLAITAGE